MNNKLDAKTLQRYIELMPGYRSLYIPEFTYDNLRIDAILIDTVKRWIRGFEIKVTRSDFLSDEKWQLYSKFCSSLSVVCPEGLIKPEEIDYPFGLLWICPDKYQKYQWKKRPKNFQRRDALAWTFTYLRVLEQEFPRVLFENQDLKVQLHMSLKKEAK